MNRPQDIVFAYHERTKHHPNRYARGPGYIDWSSEPDPFRSYEGAPLVRLPLLKEDPKTNHFGLYKRGDTQPSPFTLQNIAAFLELSLGLSAWKSYGASSWALRMNPSSGNLHPTEAYIIAPPLAADGADGLPGGVFHYNPYLHALEQRAAFGEGLWSAIRKHFKAAGFLVALSSIHWREAWKYGERAFRYSHLDVGHAIACLCFSANIHGWKLTCLNSAADKDIGAIVGLDKIPPHAGEREYPAFLGYVHEDGDLPKGLPDKIVGAFKSLPYSGRPNLLSREHTRWKVIEEVSEAVEKPATRPQSHLFAKREYLEQEIPSVSAALSVRQRRSATAFDGKTGVPKEHFLYMLDKTLPREGGAPFDCGAFGICVHLLLFVHRVKGLSPGLYFLVRNEMDIEDLKGLCRGEFLWQKADRRLPLFLLREGDFRAHARLASCDQEIAADGAFALSMIARFRQPVEGNAWQYTRLHWEAGMVGQVLYLEAEAHGLRGTAMGCFFDDAVHERLGLADNSYQNLFHFAVGRPVEDPRIATRHPYFHLKNP